MRRFTPGHGRYVGILILQCCSSSASPPVSMVRLMLGADLLQGLVHMAKTEGMKGMMKGNGANCIRIIPNSAVKFFTYEHLSR